MKKLQLKMSRNSWENLMNSDMRIKFVKNWNDIYENKNKIVAPEKALELK